MGNKNKNPAIELVEISRLGLSGVRADVIFLIASSIGRLGQNSQADHDERLRLQSILMRQFDHCFSADDEDPINEAKTLFSSVDRDGIEDLWSGLERWSETHPNIVPGQLFAIPLMCKPLSSRIMAADSLYSALLERISTAPSIANCDLYLTNYLYQEQELLALGWLHTKRLTIDLVYAHEQALHAPMATLGQVASDASAEDSQPSSSEPYFIVGYIGAKTRDRKMCAPFIESLLIGSDVQNSWLSDLKMTLDCIFPGKGCSIGGQGLYPFHEGLRVGASMRKSAAMLRQAHDTLKMSSLLPAEVKVFISAHIPDEEDGSSLILRSAFVRKITREVIGGCDYPVAPMEDLIALEAVIIKCLRAIGIDDIESIRIISSGSTCDSCGEDLYLVPVESSTADTELRHVNKPGTSSELNQRGKVLH